MNRIRKGDIISLTFFTRANGFKGAGTRVLTGRCLFLQRRNDWIVLHFCVIIKYVKFIFKIPLHTPLITKIKILESRR